MYEYCCPCFNKNRLAQVKSSGHNTSSDSPNKHSTEKSLQLIIESWQKAIFEYENAEFLLILKSQAVDFSQILLSIKTSPELYISDKNSQLANLAKKMITLKEAERNLNIDRNNMKDDEDVVVLGEKADSGIAKGSTSFTSDNAHIGQKDATNLSFYTERLSQIWSHRLNSIDPTQGVLTIVPMNSPGEGLDSATFASEVIVRPKWPDFLTDVYYEVIKVNKYGHKMKRTLQLTQNHIVSIKNGNEITKFYHYLDIRLVFLKSGDQIYVIQRNNKRNLYISHIAPHILQQITTRIQVRRSLDKSLYMHKNMNNGWSSNAALDDPYGSHGEVGFSVENTAEMIKMISSGNRNDTDAVMVSFATSLKERVMRSFSVHLKAAPDHDIGEGIDEEAIIRQDKDNLVGETASSPLHSNDLLKTLEQEVTRKEDQNLIRIVDRQDVEKVVLETTLFLVDTVILSSDNSIRNNTTEKCEGSENTLSNNAAGVEHFPLKLNDSIIASSISRDAIKPRALSVSDKNKFTPQLSSFCPGTPEHLVQEAVRKIIFDQQTAEGNTRKIFIEKWFAEFHSSLKSSSELLLEVRHFIDGMHEHMVFSRAFSLTIFYQQVLQRSVLTEHSASPSRLSLPLALTQTKETLPQNKFMRRASLKILQAHNLGPNDINDSLLTLISYITFIVIEEAAFLSLKEKLLLLLYKKINKVHEEELVSRMRLLRGRTQEQWGIPEVFVSALRWSTASFELSSIEHNLTPTFQLQVLTRTMKAIYNEFRLVVLPALQERKKDGSSNVYLGADDLVPIFIFAFCQSNLKHPMLNRDLMWNLCHPDQLHGECGYYLTVYESAIDFVLNEPLDRDSLLGRKATHDLNSPDNRVVSSGDSANGPLALSSIIHNLIRLSGLAQGEERTTMRESFV